MSIFKKKVSQQGALEKVNRVDPEDIFKHLTPLEGYNYLRDVQKEFLQQWHLRRSERDIIGKLNTGAGKTLIALLMLQSKLNEKVGPAVYLCPDNQLLNQVVDQANLFNIKVVTIPYVPNQRAEFPVEFLNNEAILVTTFERLFNGRSIFGVKDDGRREIQEIGSLVIDDAHTCIKKARKQATIKIKSSTDTYQKIFKLFEQTFTQQGEGFLAALKAGESTVTRQVPYWAWEQNRTIIMELLTSLLQQEDESIIYSWGLIGNELRQCDCYINSDYLEITPKILPIEKIPSLNNAKHRYVLSATFSNDADLLNELGISRKAIEFPIEIENKGDAGERLIITPRRYHLDLEDSLMRAFISGYASKENVVILVPNKYRAKEWKDKFNATIVTKDNIIDSTNLLKNTNGNLMVFVNRYDGVDLSGNMCRILVLDGLPSAHSLRDKYHQVAREGSPILISQTAQTIEQGIGRAVRSGTDYSCIFILDNTLVNFISRNSNKKFFSSTTNAQIEFGLSLFDDEKPQDKREALNEIKLAVDAVLNRDQDWRNFHKDMILNVPLKQKEDSSLLLNLAEVEKESLSLFREEKFEQATDLILSFCQQNGDSLTEVDIAWYTELSAFTCNPVNPTRANDLQIIAKNHFPTMLKPRNNYFAKQTRLKGTQSKQFIEWLSNYDNGSDVYIAIEEHVAGLIYSAEVDSYIFEENIRKLGDVLGFSSHKPEAEEGDGPDILWRFENGVNLILEAKSQRTTEEIPRSDIEQLLHSIQWHKVKYGDEYPYVPIILHPSNKAMENAHPSSDSRVISTKNLEELKVQLIQLAETLSKRSPNDWNEKQIVQLLTKHGLTYSNFVEKFTDKIKV